VKCRVSQGLKNSIPLRSLDASNPSKTEFAHPIIFHLTASDLRPRAPLFKPNPDLWGRQAFLVWVMLCRAFVHFLQSQPFFTLLV
jgi:hypothetical protein